MASLSSPTIARLPVYLRALRALSDRGVERVSSDRLSAQAGVSPALLRRDLSALGQLGRRGVGYAVGPLHETISQALGAAEDRPVVLVGAGHLGTALADYAGFSRQGLRIRAILDQDHHVVGSRRSDLTVRAMSELADVVDETGARLAILAVPPAAAQQAADRLIQAGITGLLNFAPVDLRVPDGVNVRAVDLAGELQILAFLQPTTPAAPA